ncbi:MAG: Crp/Fnr family transcriptional regulator [Waterburya sp.]
MSILICEIKETNTLSFNAGAELPHKADHLWLIIHGVVKSYTVSEEGSLITLGFWGKEDLVGEALSKVEPYSLECLGTVEAIAVPQTHWNVLSKNLLHHAKQTQQLAYIVRNTRIARRLWLLLEWLATKFGREIAQGRLIDFKLTHQELADVISTTRITVTKTLIQFEQEGLILRPKTKCIILRG